MPQKRQKDTIRDESGLLQCGKSDTATSGKLFCAFLALIVRSYMTNCPAEHMRQNGLTLKRVLLEFDKVRCTAFPTGHSVRVTVPLTKTQRELMELLQMGATA